MRSRVVLKVSSDGKFLLTLAGEEPAKDLLSSFEPGDIVELRIYEQKAPRYILFGDKE